MRHFEQIRPQGEELRSQIMEQHKREELAASLDRLKEAFGDTSPSYRRRPIAEMDRTPGRSADPFASEVGRIIAQEEAAQRRRAEQDLEAGYND